MGTSRTGMAAGSYSKAARTRGVRSLGSVHDLSARQASSRSRESNCSARARRRTVQTATLRPDRASRDGRDRGSGREHFRRQVSGPFPPVGPMCRTGLARRDRGGETYGRGRGGRAGPIGPDRRPVRATGTARSRFPTAGGCRESGQTDPGFRSEAVGNEAGPVGRRATAGTDPDRSVTGRDRSDGRTGCRPSGLDRSSPRRTGSLSSSWAATSPPLGAVRTCFGRHGPRSPACVSWIDRRLRLASHERRGRRMRGGLRGTGRSDDIGA